MLNVNNYFPENVQFHWRAESHGESWHYYAKVKDVPMPILVSVLYKGDCWFVRNADGIGFRRYAGPKEAFTALGKIVREIQKREGFHLDENHMDNKQFQECAKVAYEAVSGREVVVTCLSNIRDAKDFDVGVDYLALVNDHVDRNLFYVEDKWGNYQTCWFEDFKIVG